MCAPGSVNPKLFTKLTSLSIRFSADIFSLAVSFAPTLKKLQLYNVSTDNESLESIDLQSDVEFAELKYLLINYRTTSHILSSTNTAAKLKFPQLEYLSLYFWNSYCPILVHAQLPAKMRKIDIESCSPVLNLLFSTGVSQVQTLLVTALLHPDENNPKTKKLLHRLFSPQFCLQTGGLRLDNTLVLAPDDLLNLNITVLQIGMSMGPEMVVKFIAKLDALRDPMSTDLKLNVKSQVIELADEDLMPMFAYIPVVYSFKNTINASDFMSVNLLQQALYAVLEEYPILVGHLQQIATGKCRVVIDSSNLNLPRFQEFSSSMHFDEFKEANFNPNVLPKGALLPDAFYTDGWLKGASKPAVFSITRFRDNSGVSLFAAVAHYVTDANGYDKFMRQWAQACHNFRGNAPVDVGAAQVTFDRKVMRNAIPLPQQPPISTLQKLYVPGGLISKFTTWVSPGFRGQLIKSILASDSISAACFYISNDKMEQLRQTVRSILKDNIRISAHDLLLGSLIIAYAQSIIKHKEYAKPGWLEWLSSYIFHVPWKSPSHFTTLGPADIRHRLESAALSKYIGNAIVATMVLTPIELLKMPATPELVATIAHSVRQSTDAVTKEYIAQMSYGSGLESDMPVRPLIYKSQVPERLMCTNFTRFGFYQTDFGWGSAEFVGPINYRLPKYAVFFPTRSDLGGYHVHIVDETLTLDLLKNNEFWSRNFTVVY
ncbi:hypothetical protein LPJ68_004316 [Coemansia sp. RSA 1086]|nr:hypothetical protein LPJ68_004316 [Coemansia sp. RSA 1086]